MEPGNAADKRLLDPVDLRHSRRGRGRRLSPARRLGWGWAAFVWGYALAWFLVNDRVKLLAYRVLDPAKAGTPAVPKPQSA